MPIPITIDDFSGGMRTDLAADRLPLNTSPSLLNVRGNRNTLAVRNGNTRHSACPNLGFTFDNHARALAEYVPETGNAKLVTVATTKLYGTTNSTQTFPGTEALLDSSVHASNRPRMIQFGNHLYLMDGDDAVKRVFANQHRVETYAALTADNWTETGDQLGMCAGPTVTLLGVNYPSVYMVNGDDNEIRQYTIDVANGTATWYATITAGGGEINAPIRVAYTGNHIVVVNSVAVGGDYLARYTISGGAWTTFCTAAISDICALNTSEFVACSATNIYKYNVGTLATTNFTAGSHLGAIYGSGSLADGWVVVGETWVAAAGNPTLKMYDTSGGLLWTGAPWGVDPGFLRSCNSIAYDATTDRLLVAERVDTTYAKEADTNYIKAFTRSQGLYVDGARYGGNPSAIVPMHACPILVSAGSNHTFYLASVNASNKVVMAHVTLTESSTDVAQGLVTPAIPDEVLQVSSGTAGGFLTVGDYYCRLTVAKNVGTAYYESEASAAIKMTLAGPNDYLTFTIPTAGLGLADGDYLRVYVMAPGSSDYYLAREVRDDGAGSTWTVTYSITTFLATSSLLNATGSVLPPVAATMAAQWQGRAVYVGVEPATEDTPAGVINNTLYISAIGDYERIPTISQDTLDDTDGTYITLPTGNEPITGLGAYSGYLLAFTATRTFLVTGSGPSTFQQVEFHPTVGCDAHETIGQVGGLLLWLGSGSVYAFDGQQIKEIGAPLTTVWQALDVSNQRQKAFATVDSARGQYALFVPSTATATALPNSNCYVLDMARGLNTERNLFIGAWFRDSVMPGACAVYAAHAATPGVYAGDRYGTSNGGAIFLVWKSGTYTDASADPLAVASSIYYQYRTPFLRFSDLPMWVCVVEMQLGVLNAISTGHASLTASIYPNGVVSSSYLSLFSALPTTANTAAVSTARPAPHPSATLVQVQVDGFATAAGEFGWLAVTGSRRGRQ